MKQENSCKKNSRDKKLEELLSLALEEIENKDWPDIQFVRSRIISALKVLKEK